MDHACQMRRSSTTVGAMTHGGCAKRTISAAMAKQSNCARRNPCVEARGAARGATGSPMAQSNRCRQHSSDCRAALRCIRRCHGGRITRRVHQRQGDGEQAASVATRALGDNRAAVCVNQFPHDRQADPKAGVVQADGARLLHEAAGP